MIRDGDVMKLLLKIFVVLFCYVDWALTSNPPRVETNQGSLEGLTQTSRNGNPYHIFRGIPYAEFPGRFEVATNFKSWKGIRPAKEFGNECSQVNLFSIDEVKYTGDEDCLFLNVYTPTLDTNAQLPILFWIHGGGYAESSGNGFDGKYFVDENVIVVSINYRLGPLGFLSFGEEGETMANIGMKDQLLALRWVNKNIQAFGGDPSKVTIAGFSAGGACVHLHMLSELSSGLFRAAISHSGTAVAYWAIQRNPRDYAIKLASELKCPTPEKLESSIKDTMTCLKSKSAKELTAAQMKLKDWHIFPPVTFGPVIESQGKDSFITEDPELIIHNGNYNKVNWINGFTEDEGAIFEMQFTLNKSLTEVLEKNWGEIAPIVLGYQHLEPTTKELISKHIRQHYFEHYEIEEMTWSASLRKMFSDRCFKEPVLASVEMHSRHLEGRVFPFVFRFSGDYSSLRSYFGIEGDHGVSHGDDLLYLFPGGSYGAPDYSGDTSVELVEFSKKFVKLWASFIHTTEPIDSWEKEPFWKHYSGHEKFIPFYEIAAETGWDHDISPSMKGLQEALPRKYLTNKFDKVEL